MNDIVKVSQFGQTLAWRYLLASTWSGHFPRDFKLSFHGTTHLFGAPRRCGEGGTNGMGLTFAVTGGAGVFPWWSPSENTKHRVGTVHDPYELVQLFGLYTWWQTPVSPTFGECWPVDDSLDAPADADSGAARIAHLTGFRFIASLNGSFVS